MVALEDDTWWDLPGDWMLSIDAASFRGTDLCITIARLAPERRVLTILADDHLPRWTRGSPGSRRRCGPASAGLHRHDGRVRESPAARVSARGRPDGPLSPHSGRDGPGGRGALSREHLTKITIQRWPLIKGVENLRPR